MMSETITLQVPETIYQRLADTARATNRPLEDILLQVLEVGSPPQWTDVPEAFQKDLAALDSLENDALWQIAYSQMSDNIPVQLDALLEPQHSHPLTADEQKTLENLQTEADRFMLRKAQAAAILRWRGFHVPPP
ncbi:MAG: hypothetical protein F6K47_07015 [Symploca sp. SIO2E6]|nr:hypothetical protein [Symploca sp. SIO2E6]